MSLASTLKIREEVQVELNRRSWKRFKIWSGLFVLALAISSICIISNYSNPQEQPWFAIPIVLCIFVAFASLMYILYVVDVQ